jgi:diacylglycerol kinase (ATP)
MVAEKHHFVFLEAIEKLVEQIRSDDTETGESLRIFVVLNPVAGFTNASAFRRRLRRFCKYYHCLYEVHETCEDEDLKPIIEQAIRDGYQVFVAAGGDGTISQVASCLAYTDLPLGIIPVGTGNALARGLGLPQDFASAFRLIVCKHQYRMLDALRINGQYHVLNAGVGVTSKVVLNTPRPVKRRYGMLAYIWEAIKALFGIQPHSFRLTIDGRKYRLRASEVFIACGGWLGIQLPFTDLDIQPDDGRVDVFVVKARNLGGYIRLAFSLLFGRRQQALPMKHIPAYHEILIETRHPLPVQSDGDWIGKTPVKIEVCPKAIRLIVPSKDSVVWSRLLSPLPTLSQLRSK